MKPSNECASPIEVVQHEGIEPTGARNTAGPDPGDGFTLRRIRDRAEIQAIQQALGYAGWNRTQAARLLEISYRSLLLKIQRHKITRQNQ